jgi:hypothetical protein
VMILLQPLCARLCMQFAIILANKKRKKLMCTGMTNWICQGFYEFMKNC